MTQRHLLTAFLPLIGAAALVAATGHAGCAQPRWRGGQVVIPQSSIEQPEHIGVQAHTSIRVFVPVGGMDAVQPPSFSREAAPQESPPYAGYFFETPASLGCVYKLVAPVAPGCNPNTVVRDPSGGSRAIAIVDAYHYPTAVSDLRLFSAQFGLPLPTGTTFQIVYGSGRQPAVNADWNLEEALDIEWAHAMAPAAKLYLVEAASASFGDLLPAVSVANSLVKAAGGGEVSISWGGSEFPTETSYDQYFTQPGVVYLAASGDNHGVMWPSTSPNVVSVGGTSISRNPSTGAFQQEVAWQSAGGGPSTYETRPSYQNGIAAVVKTQRGSPDVAADADPSTGVWVYDSPYWYVVGGTSVSTPVWAGIVNAAGGFSAATRSELATVYANQANAADFTGIIRGSCGPNEGYLAAGGWSFCTGVGSPLGERGK
jgi:kumamolisin